MLNSVSTDLIYQPADKEDKRLSQIINQNHDYKNISSSYALIGYPDDEGVKINGGRVGAALGPNSIRKYLYKMTVQNDKSISDVGNLSTNHPLETRHSNAQEITESLLENNNKCICLGGGHDYGFPDGLSFIKNNKSAKPLVLNFDAHLDVRSTELGLSSGTPFYRLKKSDLDYDMIQLGIQSQCNSQKHINWCKQNNIKIETMNNIIYSEKNLCDLVFEKYNAYLIKKRPCFLSIDIDGFASSIAPGCSQSWPIGFDSGEFFKLFRKLIKHLDVQMLGIYEVSPKHDFEDITSKLAALIAYEFINS